MRVAFKTASKAVSKFFKKHGTKMLVMGACVGTVGAVVEGIRITPKAMEAIETAEIEKGEDLSVTEKIRVAGPLYLPCGIMALQAVACAIGCEVIHTKKEVALIGALTTTKAAYDEYRQIARDLTVTEKDGKEKKEVSLDQKIANGLAKKHFDEDDVPDSKIYGDYSEGLYKCRDKKTGQTFWSNQMRIEKAAAHCNTLMSNFTEPYISVGYFLDECGGEDCESKEGWSLERTGYIDVIFGSCVDKEGRPCLEINYRNDPSYVGDVFY